MDKDKKTGEYHLFFYAINITNKVEKKCYLM